jgi:hypothetical protein
VTQKPEFTLDADKVDDVYVIHIKSVLREDQLSLGIGYGSHRGTEVAAAIQKLIAEHGFKGGELAHHLLCRKLEEAQHLLRRKLEEQ